MSQTLTSDRPRVLVVDDLEENRISFAAILRNENFDLDLAASANEALGFLLDNEYICALCDVQMPEIDGIEFAKIVRSDSDIVNLPILFITAHDFSAETLSSAFNIEAYDFIRKPVDPVVLRSKLRVFSKLHHQRRRIAKQAAQLEESNDELAQFVRIASHDLRSPLRAISGLANLIQDECADQLSEDGQEYLRLLTTRVDRMGALLTDLLSYSRAGREVGQITTKTFQFIIDNIIGVIDVPDGFTIEIIDGAGIEITTYVTPLTTCIRNLVSNAIKHHDKKSGKIELECRLVGDGHEFVVRDDGPGIAPDFHEQIFQMFRTLRPRDEVEGSGIGLSVIDRIVNTMGGRIRVRSDLGAGSSFVLNWPIQVSMGSQPT